MRGLQADPAMPPAILFRHPRQLDAWLAQLTATAGHVEQVRQVRRVAGPGRAEGL